MHGLSPPRIVWGWAALGLAGSLLAALAAPRAIGGPSGAWWYSVAVPGGRDGAVTVVYVGMALLCAAWVGLGRLATGPRIGWLLLIATAWLLPLALAPALFSRDLYSYLAQGTILRLGQNPYHTPPAALAGLGHGHLLAAVSPFWRHTTAPYGPLFLGLMSAITALTGSHLVAGALVTRAVELGAIALLAVFIPRLTRALGGDPARAIWLAVLNPLLVFEVVAAGHNDVLMAVLLVAGVTLALQGQPLLGVAVCTAAAAFKLPALAGAVLIAIAWAREETTTSDRIRFLLTSALTAAAVLAAVTVACGVGFSWLSTTLFSTPAKVRLAITPSTGLGWTVASLLHDAGLAVRPRSVESAFGAVTLAMTAVVGLVLAYRVRIPKLTAYLGVLLLAAAAGGPAAWPWYFSWGLVLLSAVPGAQRSLVLVLGSIVGVFLIRPNGLLALPLRSAPIVVVVYALLAGFLWSSRRGGRGRGLAAPAPSALTRT